MSLKNDYIGFKVRHTNKEMTSHEARMEAEKAFAENLRKINERIRKSKKEKGAESKDNKGK